MINFCSKTSLTFCKAHLFLIITCQMKSTTANTHCYSEFFQPFPLELPFSRHVSFPCYVIFLALDANSLIVFSLIQDNLAAVKANNSKLSVV